ncbi:MAG TPA: hypothetical protein VFE94_03340, partial [Candidatus Paceibacterota bacterium]|nr:hypothetical protein [Candidatus Paceibacterota bacterium]
MSTIAKKIFVGAVAAVMVATVAMPPVAQAQTIEQLQAQISSLLATIAQLQTQLATLAGGSTGGGLSGIPAGFTFTGNLSQGMSGQDVMYLQILLNSSADTQLASSGAGSPGSETQYFGPITRTGVVKFQNKYASEILTPLGLTAGTGFFGAGSRAKANMLLAAAPAPTPTPTPTPTPGTPPPTPPVVTPPAGNAVQVTLASDTPASTNIADAGNGNFTKFWFTAGSSDVSVSKVVVTRKGLTANADLENIKLVDMNGVSRGSVGSLNVNNKSTLTFSPALVIPANSSKGYYIRAGFVDGTTAGKTANFGIEANSDVTAGSATVMGAPIYGNEMSVVSLTIGSVEAKEDGTTPDSQPDVGDIDVPVNNFKVVVGSTEAVTIEQITVQESGSASLTDTGNIELWDVTGNKSLGTVASWDAEGRASWANLNVVVDKGKTHRFKVRLDILDGPSLTVNADLMDGSDVLMAVKGNTYNFYITPDGNDTDDWTNSNDGLGSSNQTIAAGSMVVSKSPSTPATGNIAAADDQKLATFDYVVKGEEMRVSSTVIDFDFSGLTCAETTSVRIVDKDNTIVAGPSDCASDALTFSDTYIVPVGTNMYSIIANISSNASTGDTVDVGIDQPGDMTVRGVTSNNTVNATPATTEVEGNTLTVKAGDLDATTLATPAARSISQGIQDFIFMTGSLSASDSGEDVNVTAITIANDPSSGASADEVINVEIWADMTAANSARGDVYETKIGDSVDYDETVNDTADTIAFTLNQTVTVMKGSFVNIAVVADLSTSATDTETHTVDISAVTANGASTGTSITVTPTGSGQAMTVTTGGTLTTTVDSSEPAASLFAANSTETTIAVFRLAANNVEDLDLDDIDLRVSGGFKVATYKFYDGTTLVKTATGGVGSSTTAQSLNVPFDDNSFVVPAAGNKKLTVKVDFLGTTTLAADNNLDVEVTMLNADSTGKSSGTTISGATDLTANAHSYFLSYPSVTVSSSSPASGNLIPSANTLLAVFDVKAGAAEDITFSTGDANNFTVSLSVTIGDSTDAAESFELKDENGISLDTVSTDLSVVGGDIDLAFDFTDAVFTVPAGQTKKLYVYGDTGDLEDDGDSIQAWLDDGTATFIDWSIDSTGSYNHADRIFRGDLF